MIERNDQKLSISRQCSMLNVNRSPFYYTPKPTNPADLELMRLIDEQYMKTPTAGSRTMRTILRRLGYKPNRRKVQRLMRLMGLEAIYRYASICRRYHQHGWQRSSHGQYFH